METKQIGNWGLNWKDGTPAVLNYEIRTKKEAREICRLFWPRRNEEKPEITNLKNKENKQ